MTGAGYTVVIGLAAAVAAVGYRRARGRHRGDGVVNDAADDRDTARFAPAGTMLADVEIHPVDADPDPRPQASWEVDHVGPHA